MPLKLILLSVFSAVLLRVSAQTRNTAPGNRPAITSASLIKVYFNHPVNTALASSIPAVYLNQLLDDTLIAYINRAKFTIDVAVYDYLQSTSISNIAAAINSAYSRGVGVRWIYNGSSSNTGLSGLNAGINKLASPTTAGYGSMHNNFMIVDAGSANASDPVVWTGSCNWDSKEMNTDVNHVVILQDQNLAQAYTSEFNQMWGSSTLVPNAGLAKFGRFKTTITPHTFTIGGVNVESYFGPADSIHTQIMNAIASANTQLYFGCYSFTQIPETDSIRSKAQNGVYTAGILDQYSLADTSYVLLHPVLNNLLKIYTQSTSVYHNDLLIVDVCNPTSDPLVETGSSYWTSSGNSLNDENILILHDLTIANLFYQSFEQNLADLGGSLNPCPLGISEYTGTAFDVNIYPNPATTELTVSCREMMKGDMTLFDMSGRELIYIPLSTTKDIKLNLSGISNGVYLLLVRSGETFIRRKVVVRK